ncbi:hypothetical protein DL93DRAFT_2083455 [Clavulina sp. PMI_390]|nr:hypothetical protein DL93DRAFT_2083455 [Clavulina sp. PMI_390]
MVAPATFRLLPFLRASLLPECPEFPHTFSSMAIQTIRFPSIEQDPALDGTEMGLASHQGSSSKRRKKKGSAMEDSGRRLRSSDPGFWQLPPPPPDDL